VTNFCNHCQGQRFDRARVLQALRQLRKDLRQTDRSRKVDEALRQALRVVWNLEIPHLDDGEDEDGGQVVH
jgi:hypothetical protein